jgi:hypothetical protein
VNVGYSVQNASEKPLEVSTFGQLKQTINLPSTATQKRQLCAAYLPWRGVLHA